MSHNSSRGFTHTHTLWGPVKMLDSPRAGHHMTHTHTHSECMRVLQHRTRVLLRH
uniref:Uncharacterized protein n=1 Tax=Anguilla anguilla TaxID=7936 RepID=A0A0E9WW27_ANGAN